MADLSKASNAVQEKYILYDVTGFTQKGHSIPVATNCSRRNGAREGAAGRPKRCSLVTLQQGAV